MPVKSSLHLLLFTELKPEPSLPEDFQHPANDSLSPLEQNWVHFFGPVNGKTKVDSFIGYAAHLGLVAHPLVCTADISPSAFGRQRSYADAGYCRSQTTTPGPGRARPLSLSSANTGIHISENARDVRSSRYPSSGLGHPLRCVLRPP